MAVWRSTGEDELEEFLTHYRKTSFQEACSQEVGALDVSAWINSKGYWTEVRLNPNGSAWPFRSESWCRGYLHRLLRLSRKEYAKAKSHLFLDRDVSGIYERVGTPTRTLPQFALVYRQPRSSRPKLVNL